MAERGGNGSERAIIGLKTKGVKKFYRKDHDCPHNNCTRKYSSKIALNAHIKKKHHTEKDS